MKKRLWNIGKTFVLSFCLLLFSSSNIIFAENIVSPDFWPIWPLSSHYPEPPRLTLHDDVYEIVIGGNSAEPISFFTIGRDLMAWVDRLPMVGLDEEMPSLCWGGELFLMDVTNDGSIKTPLYSGEDNPIYCKQKTSNGNYVREIMSSSVSDLKDAIMLTSILPSKKENWYDSNGDGTKNASNQEFEDLDVISWRNFLTGNTKCDAEGETTNYLADPGHAGPVIVWPDNVWLAPMENWMSFFETISSDYYNDQDDDIGGAVIFLPTNDGLLHAFDIGGGNEDQFNQIWTFMPPPAFVCSVYHEIMKKYRDYLHNLDSSTYPDTGYPRLVCLDGPVAIHDVQDSQGNWKRLLIGTTGQGPDLNFKKQLAWKAEGNYYTPSPPPSTLLNAHIWGIYALNITDPRSPQLEWSVTNAYWDGGYGRLWVNSDTYDFQSGSNIPESYLDYSQMCMSPTRPIFGYTNDGWSKEWHVLILGIDKSNRYRILDINPLDGSINNNSKSQLSETAPRDSLNYFDDIYNPSRIGASLPWGESTPLLGEVYFFLSNGALYRWNLEDDQDPEKLLTINGGQDGYYAQPIQDFDTTYLYVENEDGEEERHRFLAVVAGFQRNGHPNGQVITDTECLLTIDITQLENHSLPVSSDVAYDQFGKTNDRYYSTGYDFLDLMYLALRAMDDPEDEGHGKGKKDKNGNSQQGSPWNEAYPASAPIFYDGKIIMVTRGYIGSQASAQIRDAWSRVYIADPQDHDKLITLDTRGVTHLGGAILDEDAILWSPVVSPSGTNVLSQDLTDYVDPLGEQHLLPGNSEPEVLFWEIGN